MSSTKTQLAVSSVTWVSGSVTYEGVKTNGVARGFNEFKLFPRLVYHFPITFGRLEL